MPGQRAARSARRRPASPASELASLPEPGAGGDRRGHQEREASRGLAVEAGEQAGRDRDPRAADARDERQRLGDADARAPTGTSARSIAAGARPTRSASHRITAPTTSVSATSRGSRKAVSMRSSSSEPGDRRRDRGRGEQPGQPPVRVARERAVAERGEAGRDQPQPVARGSRRAARPASRGGASR